MAMQFELVRWRRYGKDRLYVNGPSGTRYGWVDLLTGHRTIEVPDVSAEFDDVVSGWLRHAGMNVPNEGDATVSSKDGSGHPQSPAEIEVQEPAAPDTRSREQVASLASNAPGAGLKIQAVGLQESAPIRTFFARVLGVHTNERAYRMGEKGESLVAAQLAKLPEPWRSVHSIPVSERGTDIDHVVIGPAGVFNLNSKHHKNASVWVAGNAFRVNGNPVHYLRASRSEGRRLESHRRRPRSPGRVPARDCRGECGVAQHQGATRRRPCCRAAPAEALVARLA